MVPDGLPGWSVADARLPLFLDIEASSLKRPVSYPTEIAWSTDDGAVHERLIRPEPHWTDWSSTAEGLTGLGRDLLMERGISPTEVAVAMNTMLRGRLVYCDGGKHDAFWLERLFDAARIRCEFQLADVQRLIPRDFSGCPDWQGELAALARQARHEAGPAHRAAADVRYLQRLYSAVSLRVAAMLADAEAPLARRRG